MFTAILGGFMDHQFGLDVKRALLKPMVEGSIEVYLRVSQELLPTPARAHYTFNLRDLSKVFQGILMIKARQVGLHTHKHTALQPSIAMHVAVLHTTISVCEDVGLSHGTGSAIRMLVQSSPVRK